MSRATFAGLLAIALALAACSAAEEPIVDEPVAPPSNGGSARPEPTPEEAEAAVAAAPEISAADEEAIRRALAGARSDPVNTVAELSIGAFVPIVVTVQPLPPEIAEATPALAGYHYFVVDGAIAIVDPNAFVIVHVVRAR